MPPRFGSKCQPYVEAVPAVVGVIRPVPFPQRGTGTGNDESHVVLGMHEPSDGRYTSLSRNCYTNAKSGQTPGSSSVTPSCATAAVSDSQVVSEHDQMVLQKVERESAMHNKTFLLSEAEKVPGSMFSGKNDKVTATHVSASSASGGGVGNNIKQNALIMNTTSLFVSNQDREAWSTKTTSTSKADFNAEGKLGGDGNLRGAYQATKAKHRSSSITLGTVPPPPWQSENRAHFTDTPALQISSKDAAAERNKAIEASHQSTVNIGSSETNIKDTLRTLKQIDFAGAQQRVAGQQPHTYQLDSTAPSPLALVLGYAPAQPASQYQVSYTPTMFV